MSARNIRDHGASWDVESGGVLGGGEAETRNLSTSLKKKLTRKNYFRIETKVVSNAITLQSKIQPFFQQQTM